MIALGQSNRRWAGCRAFRIWTGRVSTSSCEQFIELMNVNRDLWKLEILSHEELFIRLYDRLPKEMLFLKELILSGLWRSPEHWELQPEEK